MAIPAIDELNKLVVMDKQVGNKIEKSSYTFALTAKKLWKPELAA